ncbi:MAG: hypothetical protein ND866_23890 [Pyrinomonadaceae bacterium]|nr:hypothetical protein [Pyrinomonadaceae bacterium]
MDGLEVLPLKEARAGVVNAKGREGGTDCLTGSLCESKGSPKDAQLVADRGGSNLLG